MIPKYEARLIPGLRCADQCWGVWNSLERRWWLSVSLSVWHATEDLAKLKAKKLNEESKMNRLDSLRKQREEIDKHIEALEHQLNRPQMVLNVDWQDVIDMCENNINHLETHGYESKDFKDYLYETVMFALYTRDVFKWMRMARM